MKQVTNKVEQLQWLTNDKQSRFMRQSLLALETHQWLSHDEQSSRQLRALKDILRHCQAQVPYYRAMLCDVDIEQLSFDDFAKLPLLTKDDIRTHESDLVATMFRHPENAKLVRTFHTSGSTGTPLKVYRGQRHILFGQAIGLHYHLSHKRDLSLSNASVVTTDKSSLEPRNWANNLNTGPGYTLAIKQRSSEIFDQLMHIQPHYLQTHPSTLKRLIDISQQRGQSLHRLKEVRTFGELLEPNIVKSCREYWDVDIADNYSCEELATMAFSCPQNNHYHVVNDNVYMEIIDDDGKPCAPGEVGRIVVTQLKNLAMPLIRYELGDLGVWGDGCDCGRHLPVLKRIEGRRRNLVVMANGDSFHPVFDEKKILAIAAIKRYQLIQKDLTNIEIRLLAKPLEESQELALSQVFSETFKGAFTFHYIYQNEMAFSQRNKFEIFKSELSA